jgi:hypothetical protein
VAPGDLVWAVAEVIVAKLLERVSMVSISAFLETKAASACSLDLAIWLFNLGLIFVLHIGNFDEPMNARSAHITSRKDDLDQPLRT